MRLPRAIVPTVMLLAGLPPPSFAQASRDAEFAGTWTVRWLSNDTRNPISVAQSGSTLSGSYRNDAGDACPVSGSFQPQPRRVALQISCPKWRISMDGFASRDARLIVGNYTAYGDSLGGFVMSRD